jgi:hypothetical protein
MPEENEDAITDSEMYEKVEEVCGLFHDGVIAVQELKDKLILHLNSCADGKDLFLFSAALNDAFNPDVGLEDEEEVLFDTKT